MRRIRLHTSKKIALTAAAVSAVSIAAAGGTYANFTATPVTISNNAFAAGTLEMDRSGSGAVFTAANMAIGDDAHRLGHDHEQRLARRRVLPRRLRDRRPRPQARARVSTRTTTARPAPRSTTAPSTASARSTSAPSRPTAAATPSTSTSPFRRPGRTQATTPSRASRPAPASPGRRPRRKRANPGVRRQMQMRLTSVLKRTVGPIAGLAVLAAFAYLALFRRRVPAGRRLLRLHGARASRRDARLRRQRPRGERPRRRRRSRSATRTSPAASSLTASSRRRRRTRASSPFARRATPTSTGIPGRSPSRTRPAASPSTSPTSATRSGTRRRARCDMGLILLVSGLVLAFLLQAIWRRPDTPAEAPAR